MQFPKLQHVVQITIRPPEEVKVWVVQLAQTAVAVAARPRAISTFFMISPVDRIDTESRTETPGRTFRIWFSRLPELQ